MKKLICILTAALLCLVSCNKDNSSSYTNLPGTTWADSDGNVVSFTKTTISLNGASASYSVTLEAPGQLTNFTVDDLKVGDKVYISGSAIFADKVLTLTQYKTLKMDYFYKK